MSKLEEVMKAIETVLVIKNRQSIPICKEKIAKILKENKKC